MWIHFQATHDGVAPRAEDTTHLASDMAVIHKTPSVPREHSYLRLADLTPATLALVKFNLLETIESVAVDAILANPASGASDLMWFVTVPA